MTYRTSLPLHPTEDGKPKKRKKKTTATTVKSTPFTYKKTHPQQITRYPTIKTTTTDTKTGRKGKVKKTLTTTTKKSLGIPGMGHGSPRWQMQKAAQQEMPWGEGVKSETVQKKYKKKGGVKKKTTYEPDVYYSSDKKVVTKRGKTKTRKIISPLERKKVMKHQARSYGKFNVALEKASTKGQASRTEMVKKRHAKRKAAEAKRKGKK